jgi:hypothetical protein
MVNGGKSLFPSEAISADQAYDNSVRIPPVD